MNSIVITGCDRTGKSTLARELSKRLYMPVVNRLKPKDNIFIECIDTLTQMKEPMIIDRFHIDEEVYGPIKRGQSRFDFRQYKIVELLMKTAGTFNIYCYSESDKIKDRFENDSLKETFLSVDEIDPIVGAFEKEIGRSLLDWHRYKIGDDYDELVKKINTHFFNNEMLSVQRFIEYRTLGNLQGSVLFVGDKYGDKLLPPLVPFGNNDPGLHLFQAIDAAGFDWKDLMITNSVKTNEQEIGKPLDAFKSLREELTLPNLKKVICLGNNAEGMVRVAGETFMPIRSKRLEYYKVPHPSSSFVYKHQSVEEYANILKQCTSN